MSILNFIPSRWLAIWLLFELLGASFALAQQDPGRPVSPDAPIQRPLPDLGQGQSVIDESQDPRQDTDDQLFERLGINLGDRFLYDAQTIGFDRDGNRYLFKGDVVLIGAGSLITADEIRIDYEKRRITADGHVVFLANQQVFTGKQVSVQWETGDFEITEAIMTANAPQRLASVSREILGVSQAELEYLSAKNARLSQLQQQKQDLRQYFQRLADEQALEAPPEPLVDSYARVLEQEALVQKSQPPNLSETDDRMRKSYLKRRRYWEATRQETAQLQLKQSYYFKLSGKLITRRQQNDYEASEAIWTTCRCEDDEIPAWGFRADKIQAQEEGYVDLSHPVLFIKGIPILYIPYLKVPFKSRRQSGFLMPGFQTGNRANGFVYSQPVYLAFDDSFDATLTTDVYQKRGTRLGLEMRYAAREHSGFELSLETIRDRAWLEKRTQRDELQNYFLGDGRDSVCGGLVGPDLEACLLGVRSSLAIPSNTWRGRQQWKGKYFLSPRWSLASRGTMVSDHRYIEDLYVPEDYVAAFSTRADANAFTTAKTRLNYDGRDFFLGIGSYFGDSVVQTDQFKGFQMPLSFRFMSRNFSLLPKDWGVPDVYGNLQVESYLIQENKGNPLPGTVELKNLGNGQWQRVYGEFIAPLIKEGVVTLDYFADLDARQIFHDGLSPDQSSIRSWRSGLTLNLPIDGMGALPDFLQDENFQRDPSVGTRYLHHLMNWSITYSARPVVIRRGPYAETTDANGAPLVYFASDRNFLSSSDTRDISNEETMVPHQRVTFSTSHRWLSFREYWNTSFGVPKEQRASQQRQQRQEENQQRLRNLHEQAKRELLASVDKKQNDVDQMFTEDQSSVQWHINRYSLSRADSYEPINLSVTMTYDLEQERLRKQRIERNEQLEAQAAAAASPTEAAELRAQKVPYPNLPESWTGPYFNLGLSWAGYRLYSRFVYNMYKKTTTSSSYTLGLPAFYQTSLALSYVLDKTPGIDPETQDLIFQRTRTASVGIGTSIIPRIGVGINLVEKRIEGAAEPQYGTSINISYNDPSACWGLRFVREKDLNQNEENANYVLQISMIFLGNARSGDISPALEREIPRFTFTN